MREVFVRALVLCGLVTLMEACQGPTGPAGPAGSSIDRSMLYCRQNAAILNAATSNLMAFVNCDAKTDIPWEGYCESSEMPPGVYLSVNEEVGWNDITVLPGWKCGWAAQDIPPNQNFGGTATICCLAVGHTP